MKNKMFEDYFLKYKNLVIRVVMNKTGDYQVAQEICQQVFASLYKNMESISPDLIKAWLIRSAQNAAIDYLRRFKKRKEISYDAGMAEEGNLLVEESLEVYQQRQNRRELAGRILREVKAVNEQWFEVLMLNCVEGMSYAEMEKHLKVPESVLRARMYRARVYIKEKYKDEYP